MLKGIFSLFQDALVEFQTNLVDMMKTLTTLQQKLNTQVTKYRNLPNKRPLYLFSRKFTVFFGFQPAADVYEERKKLESLLSIQLPSLDNISTTAAIPPAQEFLQPQAAAPCKSTRVPNEECTEVDSPTPYERRKFCSEFIEISKEEFLTVSEFTRGRLKLGELNQVRESE